MSREHFDEALQRFQAHFGGMQDLPAGSLLSGINEFTFSMYTVAVEAF